MAKIKKELLEYIWNYINLINTIFPEKIYQILLKFKVDGDKNSFTNTIEAICEVDDTLLEKIKENYKNKNKKRSISIEKLKKAIEINPNNDKVYSSLGEAYYYEKEYSKAIEYFKKTIEINPNNDKVYSGLGLIYYNQKEYDKAIEYFKKAIEVNLNNDIHA